MELDRLFAIILTLLGAGTMTLAFPGARAILGKLQNRRYFIFWQYLLAFVGVSIFSYIVAAFLLFLDIQIFLFPLIGLLFFGGAAFTYLFVKVSTLTVKDFFETSISLDALEQKIKERTLELQQKNEELIQSHQELARTRDEALQANRAKAVFLTNMNHELRTPLNAIINYGEMLHEELTDLGHEEVTEDVQRIIGSGKHLLLLIEDILDMAGIEVGRVELKVTQFKVVELLQEVVDVVRPVAKQNNNELQVALHPKLDQMQADRHRVHQIVFNLLSNACKFTQNGQISLTAEPITHTNQPFLQLAIRDTGIGLSAEQINKMFQPFVQVDSSTTRKYGGTGLGLALTKHFCDMMGGTVQVTSDYGTGSTFTVQLPLFSTKRPVALAPAEFNNSDNQPVILVIDDDPIIREILTRYLEKEGYKVATASGGHMGISLAQSVQPLAITLDVMMPDMDGWTVLQHLRSNPHTAHVPVVMLTLVDDKERGMNLGATDYLTKPINREQLKQLLQKYQVSAQGNSILIVEDDKIARDIMRRVVQKQGWRVLEAENGEEGLRVIAQRHPSAILLDLMMPEMDGFMFLDKLQEMEGREHTPVVVLTAQELTSAERTKLTGRVQAVLQKGYNNREAILNELRQILSKRSAE